MNMFSYSPLLLGRWAGRRAFAGHPVPWPGPATHCLRVPTPRGRLLHGRHFTYKSITGDMAITFVSTGVEGAFATEEHPYAAHGPWLQVRRLIFLSLPSFCRLFPHLPSPSPPSPPSAALGGSLPEGLAMGSLVECGCCCLSHQL